MKYIDADKLKEILKTQIKGRKRWMKDPAKSDRQDQLWSDLNGEDMSIVKIIDILQQEQQEDTDALRAKLVNFLTRNDIQEDKAKYLADRISDTYGAQRYLDGLCDTADAYEQQEQSEVDLEKEINSLDDTYFDLDGIAVVGATYYITVEDLKDIARHFYELGLNARKEE